MLWRRTHEFPPDTEAQLVLEGHNESDHAKHPPYVIGLADFFWPSVLPQDFPSLHSDLEQPESVHSKELAADDALLLLIDLVIDIGIDLEVALAIDLELAFAKDLEIVLVKDLEVALAKQLEIALVKDLGIAQAKQLESNPYVDLQVDLQVEL